MSDLLIKPGISLGSYPQRDDDTSDELEASVREWVRKAGSMLGRRRLSQRYIVRKVARASDRFSECTDAVFDERVIDLKTRLVREGLKESLMIEAFALIREASWRVLGMRHFDVQLYGGWLMINGLLAEMQTGEGKTLTTALPACTAALAGIPVHVITANDYLAKRDCEIMLPLYERLGVTAASVVDGMEPAQCQQAYQSAIVHTTNKQVAFDYLRDRIEMGEDTGDLRLQYRQIQRQQQSGGSGKLLLRGLCFAIVDEADSVLIDEANTPLIITRTLDCDESAETYSDAIYLASMLSSDRHYTIDEARKFVELTVAGEDVLEDHVLRLPKVWKNKRKRETLVRQALAATHCYLRDREYVVHEDKVQIIDQSTGRLMPDRAWEQGLHQMIETKEGCLISEQREPLARISYQRFFSRYLRLGGASGTLQEVAGEMQSVYGLDVLTVPTHQPSKRKILSERIFADEQGQKLALTQRLREFHRQGRPILIGTRSVEESERVSVWLDIEDIPHNVLNAKQDQREAEIVSSAGGFGMVTVATNMAGRGTDIKLGPGVEELGGLHVVSLSLNDSYRVDRQLFGRCARQGDPGTAEAILSLEDPMLVNHFSGLTMRLLRSLCSSRRPIPAVISRSLLRSPQKGFESCQRRIRKALTKQDKRLRRTLAFSGRFE